MSTSIAIASAANVQATVAAAEANRAADIACQSLVKGYTHAGSSTDEMHEYVACVERLYPTPDYYTPMPLKVCILAALLGAVIGAILNSDDRVFGAMIGLLVPIGGILLGGLVLLLFL